MGDVLSYSATQANGSPLPTWLGFDSKTQSFTGTPRNADVGKLAITVKATDPSGDATSTSFELAINNTNDLPTGRLIIAGSAEPGKVLGVSATALSDEDGMGVPSYQWQLSANGSSSWTDIVGATGDTLMLTPQYSGQAVRAIASYTDLRGTQEHVTSSPTARVGGVEGDNQLHGGNDNDQIFGGAGADTLYGEEGDDHLAGGTGNDTLHGGAGNDLLQGGNSDAGRWTLFLDRQHELDVRYAFEHPTMTDAHDLDEHGSWSNPSGQGTATDGRIAWIYDHYSLAQDTALLFHAVVGRLPTLLELGAFASGEYTNAKLGEMAHNFFVRTHALEGVDTSALLGAVATQVWGAGALPASELAADLQLLNGGTAWSTLWLSMVHDARHTAQLPQDPSGQGRMALVMENRWGEAGWSLNPGDNQLFGEGGNDVLVGGTGNNLLDGGAGTDTAVLMGAVADFELAYTTSGVFLRNTLSGALNTLRDVEWLEIGGVVFNLQSAAPGSPLQDPIKPLDYSPLQAHVALVGAADLLALGVNSSWVW